MALWRRRKFNLVTKKSTKKIMLKKTQMTKESCQLQCERKSTADKKPWIFFFRIYCLRSAAHSTVFNSHENWQLGKPKCWKLRKLPWEPSCPNLKNMSYPTVTSQAAECEPVAGGISESANVPSAKLKASIRKCSSSLEKRTHIALTKFWKNTR